MWVLSSYKIKLPDVMITDTTTKSCDQLEYNFLSSSCLLFDSNFSCWINSVMSKRSHAPFFGVNFPKIRLYTFHKQEFPFTTNAHIGILGLQRGLIPCLTTDLRKRQQRNKQTHLWRFAFFKTCNCSHMKTLL